MVAQGWNKNEYSVYKEGRFDEIGYFTRLHDVTNNPNGFYHSTLDFFHDILEGNHLSPSDVQLLDGNCATEVLDKPARYPNSDMSNPYRMLKRWIAQLKGVFSRDYLTWDSVLMPYISYEFLDVAFRLSREWHTLVTLPNGQLQPAIQMEMLRILGDKCSLYLGHKYNFNVKRDKRESMVKWWSHSRFLHDFSDHDIVRTVNPSKMQWGTLENKVYNLALTYDGALS